MIHERRGHARLYEATTRTEHKGGGRGLKCEVVSRCVHPLVLFPVLGSMREV